ncbi:ATP-binding protein [Couchioplanes caeruleus]|uniref:AAA family ATPase n=1 Tax=Couchioplanes caeruleus TaxID=56438 RepID=UPI0020C0A4FF|nr:ATP-binding protein [Couchioplanes caeruleus]UQU63026.1 ATP-binding protein [Couchioplanes caeruleus]
MRLLCPTVVGRAAELDLLGRLVPAAAGGTGGTVFLTGSAGMGKTRLARAAQQQAAELGLVVLRGRAVPSVQFRPLTEAFLGAIRRGAAPDPAELGPYRSAVARLVPELGPYRSAVARVVPELGLPRSPGIDGHPVLLAEAVLRLLVGVAGDRGCLLVLEDLHDADADTLMIVDYLADNIADQPVLLLGTMRPGQDCTALAYAAEQRRSASVLALSPLIRRRCASWPPAAWASRRPRFRRRRWTGWSDPATASRSTWRSCSPPWSRTRCWSDPTVDGRTVDGPTVEGRAVAGPAVEGRWRTPWRRPCRRRCAPVSANGHGG